MKRVIRCALALLLIAALLWLVPSEKVVAEVVAEVVADSAGKIVPIPLNQEVMDPIDAKYYTSDMSYEDPSLKIDITPGRAFDTDYLVARIKIADASQLRSALYSKNGTAEAYATVIAERVNAILAISGDNFRKNKPGCPKYIIRQGKDIFLQKWRNECFFDIMMIDEKGDIHILKTPTLAETEAFCKEHRIINSFCFGPGLVIDGVRQDKPTDSVRANGVGWTRLAQRVALCQMGELEYMVVVTGGPDNPHCKGVTIDEFVDIIYSEGEPLNVYNMDGGNSAWLAFQGEKKNTFGRRPNEGKRQVPDIIYFASAWQEGE